MYTSIYGATVSVVLTATIARKACTRYLVRTKKGPVWKQYPAHHFLFKKKIYQIYIYMYEYIGS